MQRGRSAAATAVLTVRNLGGICEIAEQLGMRLPIVARTPLPSLAPSHALGPDAPHAGALLAPSLLLAEPTAPPSPTHWLMTGHQSIINLCERCARPPS